MESRLFIPETLPLKKSKTKEKIFNKSRALRNLENKIKLKIHATVLLTLFII